MSRIVAVPLILSSLFFLTVACAKHPPTWPMYSYERKLYTQSIDVRRAQPGESEESDALYAIRRAFAAETAAEFEEKILSEAGTDHDSIYDYLYWGNFDCEEGTPSRCQSITYIYFPDKDFFDAFPDTTLHCVLWDVTVQREVERGRNATVSEREILCPVDG